MEWKAIKTAPKDGSAVLLYCEDYGETIGSVQVGCRLDGAWAFGEVIIYDNDDEEEPPTHWMPIPPPPKTKA